MKPLFTFRHWSLCAHWHSDACFVLPSLVFIEQRCSDAECKALHGVIVEFGWLWGSLVFEHQIG